MTEWLIASNNQYKTQDLIKCLAFYGIHAVAYTKRYAQLTFPDETTTSYETNAFHKAQFLATMTGEHVIGDDSGITLSALTGHLGVTTKRELHHDVAHSDNQSILMALDGQADRRAVMMSTLVAVVPRQEPIVAVGEIKGTIAMTTHGEFSTGFDKLFIPEDHHQTLAELPDMIRIPLTHRGRAASRLAAQLKGDEN